MTISHEVNSRIEIQKQLTSNFIDWDLVVKVSTSHYVFTALYCNLKRANFLHYLPEELVAYMANITDINRERNLKIIMQAKELNTLLLAKQIKPIFLKGTANLLAGTYEDIAERMVGDIDFIFSKEDYPKAINILKLNGYYEVEKNDYYFPDKIHYRRLKKDNNIAALEIHHEILEIKKYRKEFNYSVVEKNCQVIDKVRILSYANKLNLSIIAYQINDSGVKYKTIALRNAYDVFLLSKKTNAKVAVNNLDELNYPLNYFLAVCYELFNKASSLEYNVNEKTAAYLCSFKNQLTRTKATKIKHKWIQIYLFLKTRLEIIYKSILYKEYRVWFFKRVTDINWYKEKLAQLGLKK